jgi:hypothetical protein
LKKIGYSVVIIFVSFADLKAQQDCKLRKNQDSIKVYTCHTDTSRFKSIVAEFAVATTRDELVRMLLNVPNYTRWQYNTVEAKVVKEISATEKIYHTVIEAPWPVTDRDMVVHIRTKHSGDKKETMITTESERGVVAEQKGFVRVPASRALWIIREKTKNHLEIKYTMQIDPGGDVPVWLVNWVCAQAPYQSFKNLKAVLEKRK